MKLSILIVTVILAIGCNHSTNFTPPAHTRKVVVTLMDSLGTISLYVPERYDTSFAWIHDSDNKPSEKMKCRFQPKKLPINMESGWIYRMSVDSVDCLTISYLPYTERNSDTSDIYKANRYLLEDRKASGRTDLVVLDTISSIYDRPFSIMVTKDYSSKTHVYELTATSVVKRVVIEFNFKMITDKEDSISNHFVQNAMNILQTVRFAKSVR